MGTLIPLREGALLSGTRAAVYILKLTLQCLSALMLWVGRQEGHPACKNQWCGAGVVVFLELGADLLMPLPLTVSCFSKTQIGFTFPVPADLGSHGKRAVKQGCV